MEGRPALLLLPLLLLLAAMAVEASAQNVEKFFISAPTVFHRGVSEKVVVQVGGPHLGNTVSLYLEDEGSGVVVSAVQTAACQTESDIKTVDLTIDWAAWAALDRRSQVPYLLLVAECPSFAGRHITRVLVSKHRGYIFIQTNQPVYNPTQTVSYRVFTLDHTLRPHQEMFYLSVYNADGNRILKILRSAHGGIVAGSFFIPSVSKTGTWNITAHYEGDESNAASREFLVQKFVLPSFDVNIQMEQRYILLGAEALAFNVTATYSHGEKVMGAYHCQLGVATTDGHNKPQYRLIKGLEAAGSVPRGMATASLRSEDIDSKLREHMKKSLAELSRKKEKLYVKVFVTNIQSGEIQEADIYLPVLSHKYTMDLSRTGLHYFPGFPLDVVASLRLPDGSPAPGVSVKIELQASSGEISQVTTDQEGAVSATFNTDADGAEVAVQVSADGQQERKIIRRFTSTGSSFLYMSVANRVYAVDDMLSVEFFTKNAPAGGFIYYMALSRGTVVQQGSVGLGSAAKQTLRITSAMVPSFRLIGYFYNPGGEVVANSVWVDVRDACEIKVNVDRPRESAPGKTATLHFDLHGQRATVALLAVDKAFYSLNADNKLTSKQVFSQMTSYDLGCSYGGGSDSASVLVDAGLSFVSHGGAHFRKDFSCNRSPPRRGRATDLGEERAALGSSFNDTHLQDCCFRGFSLIPMRLSCELRTRRVLLVGGTPACADAFLRCCADGERLRQKKMREDAERSFGRTSVQAEIEQFFLGIDNQYVRRFFPPSFEFRTLQVDGQRSHVLRLPDSITIWEVQVVTVSAATGFCVVNPTEVRAFKRSFVSLRLPQSVKKYEQLSISPVVYNYGDETLKLAVNMEQSEGLCSPGSATTSSFVNVTVEPESSQFVTFSAVPMVTGSIPIKIRVYDTEWEMGVDAITKTLLVQAEGLEKKKEETQVIKLDGKSAASIVLDGSTPSDVVPESDSNIFVSLEGDGFGNSHARKLLSPSVVGSLIQLPDGCVEQTMRGLVPTALAIRYLDMSEQWFELPAGKRDDALDKLEIGFMHIIDHYDKTSSGAYKVFREVAYSNWMTAYVLKVLSLVAQRQAAVAGRQGRRGRVIPVEGIRRPAQYLLSVQKPDGSFSDPNPVLHREVLKGKDQDASMTAFITTALQWSLPFLDTERRNDAEAAISRATSYLTSHVGDLQHPYAVAITAHCLAGCLPRGTDLSAVWTKLQGMAAKGENGCYHWAADRSDRRESADAIAVETTAYALLTAVELGHAKWAEEAACWLTSQENYFGGYRSTQDTMVALEALAEYELQRSASPDTHVQAEFTSPSKLGTLITLKLENGKEKVETNLKKFAGHAINVKLTGEGAAKLKVLKKFHVMAANDDCAQLSINVTVEGKVKYTDKVMENYDYYDDGADGPQRDQAPQSAAEWFDAGARVRRDLGKAPDEDNVVTYKVCVSHSVKTSLTGMGIADITLLSGFEADVGDLDVLRAPPEKYITHYEVSHGRVILYFNELFENEQCFEFDAQQRVPVGLLQPAPAVFYDYYEPSKKCTVFYSAPLRSKMVSKLCSGDVCQCAERPCPKLQETFKSNGNQRLTKYDRAAHACFSPMADYAYVVSVLAGSAENSFVLYNASVTEVLSSSAPASRGLFRVFAVRLHCKARLEAGSSYLVMGKDGVTADSQGGTQYLLESNTWIERVPSQEECQKSAHRLACRHFHQFVDDFQRDGCSQ